ncbi:hypothetical protein Nhal_3745 [Nitrosococcus halophilus Nc 4]|uniref:Uncharacterized protein n=1 Tax=Nitrosococcus halophilus (strain Nc4) TaxID=472759 RepID=D5C2T8_NITHN|nr:hypothetical protein Nhal_3745 [Nitrosococcus halophilus Nc 4]
MNASLTIAVSVHPCDMALSQFMSSSGLQMLVRFILVYDRRIN